MPALHIEERTLYPPLVKYLQSIDFNAVGETKIIKKKPDIYFQTDSVKFVVEVKIGKPKSGLKAVAQASDYARKLDTQNIIILIYPEKYRSQSIIDPNIVTRIALNEKVTALVLTEYWTESITIEPAKLFDILKKRILTKEVKVDFNTTVELIGNYVKELNSIVYQITEEKLISEVVDKLDLFSSIGEIKDKETAEKQVVNLASYLLFNQLLFYHIYKNKTGTNSLPELTEISGVKDLQKYFDKITSIDYQSIYRVNILGHIPEKDVVINTLNEVIKAIKLLRAEHITHDLAGRFFHDLIPFEVRKILAAFYTHPTAAEILAGLTIESYDDNIIDPACGSGTLLVSAYCKKQDLYQKLHGYKDLKKMHKKFIEKDLTGIDIMPFAAHISAINLAMQNIEQKTNTVRIGTLDSLDMIDLLKTPSFKRKGIKISPYTTTIQLTLHEIYEKSKKIKKKGAVSAEGRGSEFFIKPADLVIMNPPFSDIHKIPLEMRGKLKKNPLGNICGNQVNLWGYFLVLANYFLKEKGRIGAVIPINFARGKATDKIRKHLFKNYHIKTIVKPVGDFAFSESSSFKDILFIAEKRKPKTEDLTTIVFLKKSIKEMELQEAREIVNKIQGQNSTTNRIVENELFSLKIVKQSELNKRIDKLMLYIGGTDFKNIDLLRQFVNELTETNSDKLFKLESCVLKEGITSPSGLGQLVYVTRKLDDSRIKRSFLILEKSGKDLQIKIKDTDISFNLAKRKTKYALRTLTGVKNLDVTNKSDFIITEDFEDFKTIKAISKWKGRFNWNIINKKIERLGLSRLVIPDKIRLNSKNTSIISVYSDKPLVLSNLFFTFKDLNKMNCKILSLSLNSILTLAQFIMLKSETLGGYIRLSATDWGHTLQIDYNKLNNNEKNKLLKLYSKIKDIEFPSIIEQLENRFWARLEIDRTVLKILGFPDKKIEKYLPQLYAAVVEELKSIKED